MKYVLRRGLQYYGGAVLRQTRVRREGQIDIGGATFETVSVDFWTWAPALALEYDKDEAFAMVATFSGPPVGVAPAPAGSKW